MKRVSCLLLLLALAGLSRPAQADYGPAFLVEREESVVMQKPGQKISYRFTCLHGGFLSQVSVFCRQAKNPLLTRLALYADKDGRPEGKILRSAEFMPEAGAWSSLALDGYRLIQEQVYHLVLEQDLLRSGGDNLVSPTGVEHLIEHGLEGRQEGFAATFPLNPVLPQRGEG